MVPSPRPPEGRGAYADEQRTRRDREEPGVVVAGRSDLEGVVAGFADSDDDSEDSQRQRERRTQTGAEMRIRPGRAEKDRRRQEAADEMIFCRGSRLRLEEVVVEDVDGNDHEGRYGESRL